MEESKRREIEARLQQLFAQNGLEPSKTDRTERTIQTPRRTVQVIRRRKGRPDRKVA